MWSIVAIFIGLKIIKKIIDRFNRPSIVVIVLASVLGLSAIMVPVYDILNLVKAYEAGRNIWKFNSFC